MRGREQRDEQVGRESAVREFTDSGAMCDITERECVKRDEKIDHDTQMNRTK